MDADKEGFLRNTRSITQIAGRAARHAGGTVILYAERRTDSIREAISESNRRREKQIAYNMRNRIVPQAAVKRSSSGDFVYDFSGGEQVRVAADVGMEYGSTGELEKAVAAARQEMEKAAKELDFAAAARHRNRMYELQEKLGK